MQRKIYSQDRGVGRNVSLPCTTKTITTILKAKNNQNCQKMKLYESPTTKELKKHSSRLVRGVETGSQSERTCSARWWPEDQVGPCSCPDKSGRTTGK